VEDALGPLVRKLLRQASPRIAASSTSCARLLQRLDDEIEDEQARRVALSRCFRVAMSAATTAGRRRHFHARRRGGGPAQQLGGIYHEEELAQFESRLAGQLEQLQAAFVFEHFEQANDASERDAGNGLEGQPPAPATLAGTDSAGITAWVMSSWSFWTRRQSPGGARRAIRQRVVEHGADGARMRAITTRRVAMKTPSLMLCVTMRMLFTGVVLLV